MVKAFVRRVTNDTFVYNDTKHCVIRKHLFLRALRKLLASNVKEIASVKIFNKSLLERMCY